MFIYSQTVGVPLYKLRDSQKFDKKYKNRINDPNSGLDYASSSNYVQPIFKEKFQSDKFVKDLLQKCKNNQKIANQIFIKSKNQKTAITITENLGIKRLPNNSPLINGMLKVTSKVRKRIISRAKTEAVSFQNQIVQRQTKKLLTQPKQQNKPFFKQMVGKNKINQFIDLNKNIKKNQIQNHSQNHSALSSIKDLKNNLQQDQKSLKDSEDSEEQNEQIFMKSTFLRSKQFIKSKQKLKGNSFDQKRLNNQNKAVNFLNKQNFKLNKVEFNNEVAFIKRKPDCLKMKAQNINQFVQQVIQIYGNRFKDRFSIQSNLKPFPQGNENIYHRERQRNYRNKTQSLSSQSHWSRNAVNRPYFTDKKKNLTSVSFYPKRSKTQEGFDVEFSKKKFNQQKNVHLQLISKNSLKTIT